MNSDCSLVALCVLCFTPLHSSIDCAHKSPELSKWFHNETSMTNIHCSTKGAILMRTKLYSEKHSEVIQTWEEMVVCLRMRLQETEKLYRVNWTKQRCLPTRQEQWERHLFWSCSRNYQALLLSLCQSIPLHIIPTRSHFPPFNFLFYTKKNKALWLHLAQIDCFHVHHSLVDGLLRRNLIPQIICPEHCRCECVDLSVLRCPS